MPLTTYIAGSEGDNIIADVHTPYTHEIGHKPPGIVVYSEPRRVWEPRFEFVTNDIYGADLNINGSVGGGISELLHNGASDTGTPWTGVNTAGVEFNFDSSVNPSEGSYHIRVTSGNNSEAVFTDQTTIEASAYDALTGSIYLTTFSSNSSIRIDLLSESDVVLGSVDLQDFIDITNLVSYQTFSVPMKTSVGFNLSSGTIKKTRFFVSKTGGASPSFDLDGMRFTTAADGAVEPTTFTYVPQINRAVQVYGMSITIVAAYNGITTVAGSTENATLPALSYDKFLSLPTLQNGVLFQIQSNSRTILAGSVKNLYDFMQYARSSIKKAFSDGTNTMLDIHYDFEKYPIYLEQRYLDSINVTVRDDLSSLLKFKISLDVVEEVFREDLPK